MKTWEYKLKNKNTNLIVKKGITETEENAAHYIAISKAYSSLVNNNEIPNYPCKLYCNEIT